MVNICECMISLLVTDERSILELCFHVSLYNNSVNTSIHQVNNNGHLPLGPRYRKFNPRQLPFEVPLIIVYWADVDTSPDDGGYAWYRITTSQNLLQRAVKDIQRAYPFVSDEIDYLLIATWDHVGYWPRQTDKVGCTQHIVIKGLD